MDSGCGGCCIVIMGVAGSKVGDTLVCDEIV